MTFSSIIGALYLKEGGESYIHIFFSHSKNIIFETYNKRFVYHYDQDQLILPKSIFRDVKLYSAESTELIDNKKSQNILPQGIVLSIKRTPCTDGWRA